MDDHTLAARIQTLLHDPDIAVRRSAAHGLMNGSHGRSPQLRAAFATVLAEATDRILRHRAATYLTAADAA
jgi:hypothetical protein